MKKNSNIHIVGITGAEGTAISHFLVKKGYKNITAHDFCTEKEFAKSFYKFHQELGPSEKIELLKKTKKLPIKFCYKENYLEKIETSDIIFVPQSWYLYQENKKLFTAQKKGIKLKTMVELYLEYAKCKTIGITGSNGKTTTSNLIYEVLKKYHKNTFLVGNDRQNIQILERIETLKKVDYLILEISNRHLKMDFPISPNIAVITNITPNHLNEHKSFNDYAKTKLKIFKNQGKADFTILNFDNPILRKVNQIDYQNKIIFFSKENNSCNFHIKDNFIFNKSEKIINLKNIKLLGSHNHENILAAVTALMTLAVPVKIIQKVVSEFSGVHKRLEEIGIINHVKFINDLSSTTPESTIKAIESFKGEEITLIVGGDDKELEMNELAQVINKNITNLIFHEGKVSKKLIPLIQKNVNVEESKTIENTILLANRLTKKDGIVLFSPVGEKFISEVLKYQSLNKLVLELL